MHRCFCLKQAYGYDDHGLSEQWMKNYIGESSFTADAAAGGGASASQEGDGSSQQKTASVVGQLSDEASRSQVI